MLRKQRVHALEELGTKAVALHRQGFSRARIAEQLKVPEHFVRNRIVGKRIFLGGKTNTSTFPSFLQWKEQHVVGNGLVWEYVSSKEETHDVKWVCDVAVERNTSFIANQFVVHNSHMAGDFIPPGETTSIIFQAAGTIFLFGSTEDSYLRFCANALHLAEDELAQMLWMGRGEGMLRYYGDPRAMAVKIVPEQEALTKKVEDGKTSSENAPSREQKKSSSVREAFDNFVMKKEIAQRFPK